MSTISLKIRSFLMCNKYYLINVYFSNFFLFEVKVNWLKFRSVLSFCEVRPNVRLRKIRTGEVHQQDLQGECFPRVSFKKKNVYKLKRKIWKEDLYKKNYMDFRERSSKKCQNFDDFISMFRHTIHGHYHPTCIESTLYLKIFLISLYRKMGGVSTPSQKIISWTIYSSH